MRGSAARRQNRVWSCRSHSISSTLRRGCTMVFASVAVAQVRPRKPLLDKHDGLRMDAGVTAAGVSVLPCAGRNGHEGSRSLHPYVGD